MNEAYLERKYQMYFDLYAVAVYEIAHITKETEANVAKRLVALLCAIKEIEISCEGNISKEDVFQSAIQKARESINNIEEIK